MIVKEMQAWESTPKIEIQNQRQRQHQHLSRQSTRILDFLRTTSTGDKPVNIVLSSGFDAAFNMMLKTVTVGRLRKFLTICQSPSSANMQQFLTFLRFVPNSSYVRMRRDWQQRLLGLRLWRMRKPGYRSTLPLRFRLLQGRRNNGTAPQVHFILTYSRELFWFHQFLILWRDEQDNVWRPYILGPRSVRWACRKEVAVIKTAFPCRSASETFEKCPCLSLHWLDWVSLIAVLQTSVRRGLVSQLIRQCHSCRPVGENEYVFFPCICVCCWALCI